MYQTQNLQYIEVNFLYESQFSFLDKPSLHEFNHDLGIISSKHFRAWMD